MPDTPDLTLTPDQVAAVTAADGFAHATDPVTKRTYLVVDQGVAPTFEDEYLRSMIQEGLDQLDRGESRPWDANELKEELRRRYRQRDPA